MSAFAEGYRFCQNNCPAMLSTKFHKEVMESGPICKIRGLLSDKENAESKFKDPKTHKCLAFGIN